MKNWSVPVYIEVKAECSDSAWEAAHNTVAPYLDRLREDEEILDWSVEEPESMEE